MSFMNLKGHRFGDLVVCGDCTVNDNGQREWPCTCSRFHGIKMCGKVLRVLETDLLEGNVLNCGCYTPKEEG